MKTQKYLKGELLCEFIFWIYDNIDMEYAKTIVNIWVGTLNIKYYHSSYSIISPSEVMAKQTHNEICRKGGRPYFERLKSEIGDSFLVSTTNSTRFVEDTSYVSESIYAMGILNLIDLIELTSTTTSILVQVICDGIWVYYPDGDYNTIEPVENFVEKEIIENDETRIEI